MSLIAELRRRNVFRVGVAYVIVGWLLIQVADVVLPTFEAPEWVMQVFTFLVILGFPLALIFAWAFELTPEGIKRESDVDRAESITHVMGRKLDFAIIGLLVIAVVFLVVDNYVLEADPEPAAESTGQVKSIAVLPFANMSGDPDQEFFSDGISEELLNVLAKVKGLRVTSRTSAFAFKGTNTSIPEIAEKLGVKHVLEGSVRMAGDRVRITTQLIEVETDSHLWSESYDRELSDIFAVQNEIAAKVGEALKVALLGADSKPIRPSGKTSIEVYSDYLLARQMLASFKIAEWGKAERLFKSVIERDPGYAPAYSALASLYYEMATAGVLSYSEASDRMTPAIEQALSLDPELAEAWQSLAWLRHADGDLEGARAARERALDLDPQNPFVLGQQITNWIYTHEPERGLAFADELLRVDPLSTVGLGTIAYLYERLGRDDDAERIWERIYSIDPEDVFYWWNTSLDARKRGDLVRALRQMREYTTIDPDESEGPAIVAAYYFDLGDVVAAEFWKEASLQRDPEAPVGKRIAALLQLYHDDEAAALAIAREIIQPAARTRGALAAALRMVATSDLAEGNDQDAIDRYLAYYPELADAKFSLARAALEFNTPREFFYITVDLAAAYLHAGEQTKADQLLSWVESELPHWGRDTGWGSGFADVQLHALRGEKEKALVALQEHAEMGTRYMWRWHILYNPNLDSIRDAPEFSAAVAKIEADMAEQLARVRDMERRGELVSPAELPTPTDHASGPSPTDHQ